MKIDNELYPLFVLVNRLNKINVKITFVCNYPWIYLESINDKKVVEKTFDSNHGFNIAWLSVRKDKSFYFTNTKEMFDLIRQYK